MGGGDLRLGAFLGFILGWQLTVAALAFAYIVGGTVGIILMASGTKKRTDTIPFGPFLVGGTLFAILWGDVALRWYLSLIS
jgi:prepilin signal peptidase PulO-like enzyme (type II secretory pathway)